MCVKMNKREQNYQPKINGGSEWIESFLIKQNRRDAITYCDSAVVQEYDYIVYKSEDEITSHNWGLDVTRSWEELGVQCTISYGNLWNEDVFNLLTSNTNENVEGIYFIISSHSQNDFNIYLEHLTRAIRRLNRLTKYFAVIDAREGISNNIIKLTEPDDRFMTIKLPSLKVESNEYFSVSDAINAIEKAICYKQPLTAVHRTQTYFNSFFEELAILTGFPILDDTLSSQDITLEELGMDQSKSQIVRAYLRDVHNISLDESNIPALTINQLWELAGNVKNEVLTEAENLETFFSHVDPDELLGTLDMLLLPTLSNNYATGADEYDVNETYLCIVPGVEGLHVRFRQLCEHIKLPALVLQPGVDKPHETIQELAKRYTEILQKKIQLKQRFFLLGYESGVLVALEMAAILEDTGLSGTVFCIGGGPQEVVAAFDEKLAKFETEESLQVAVANHMFNLLVNDAKPGVPGNLETALKNISLWEDKVLFCVQMLLGRIDHSIQYAKELIEAAYARILQVRRYDLRPRSLRSRLILIRPWSSACSSNSVNSVSLQSLSLQKILEYQLQVPLAHASQDMRCAAIVNRHLDKDILEEFEKKNLCDTYQMKSDTYVSIESMFV